MNTKGYSTFGIDSRPSLPSFLPKLSLSVRNQKLVIFNVPQHPNQKGNEKYLSNSRKEQLLPVPHKILHKKRNVMLSPGRSRTERKSISQFLERSYTKLKRRMSDDMSSPSPRDDSSFLVARWEFRKCWRHVTSNSRI